MTVVRRVSERVDDALLEILASDIFRYFCHFRFNINVKRVNGCMMHRRH